MPNQNQKMNADLPIPSGNKGKLRRDWGTQNIVGLDKVGGPSLHAAQVNVNEKIENFIARAIHPQQLSVPRQYATTKEGVFVVKVMEGRIIDGVQEQGARVVVQENKKMARFVISPLFISKHDALGWASQHMGAEHGHI